MQGNHEPTARQELLDGIREELPLMLGVIPFGVLFGVLGVEVGLEPLAVFFMSSIVFGGASQIVFTQLVAAGASGGVIASIVGIVNLRHMLYSATMAQYLSHLPRRWKIILSYLLTDEAFFISHHRITTRPHGANMHYHLLGTGLTLWSSWQIATLVGIIIGEAIPPSLNLSFVIPLTFLAVLIPYMKSNAVVTIVVAASLALMTQGLAWNLWVIVASIGGMAAGYATETFRKPQQ